MYMTNFYLVDIMKDMLNPLSDSYIVFQKTSWWTWTSRNHHWMDSQYGHICLSVTVKKYLHQPLGKKKKSLL